MRSTCLIASSRARFLSLLLTTDHAPWTVVKSNDKKRARLEAIRHVLRKFDYEGKDEAAIGEPDKSLIGPPSMLSEHNPGLSLPAL